jgi:hypothetical protein
MIYYAISIQQPWPYAILYLNKDVENRTWDLPCKFYGATVLIHAGQSYDSDGHRWIIKHGYALPPCRVGGIVGAFTFSRQVKPGPRSQWAEPGMHWWPIESSWPLKFFLCKGRPSFFKVDYPYEVSHA